MYAPSHRGFTLIELVMVIVLTGALFATASIFIVGPTEAYADLSRRAMLVDAADLALRRMARDIRSAVPNSVRVDGSGFAIEMLATTSGARYRASADAADATADSLQFDDDDPTFDVLGGFPGLTAASDLTGQRLVIFNLGTSGSNAYEDGSEIITPATTTLGIAAIGTVGDVRLTLTPGFKFAWESPEQRIFMTSGVTRYTCVPNAATPATGTLRRAAAQAIAASMAYDTTAAAGDLVTQHISSCTFSYTAGSASRSAVVTLRITLTDGDESIRLLRQVQVDNLP